MSLYRLTLTPRSPWRTPWQADTLLGLLLATCARTRGGDVLKGRLIEPMLAGQPPFVLSDACPGDLLPAPTSLRLARWPDSIEPKTIKRIRWLTPHAFEKAQRGGVPDLADARTDDQAYPGDARQHNTLSRLTDATVAAAEGAAGSPAGIFQRREWSLGEGLVCLSVYVRLLDPLAGDLLLELFHQLSLTGFGADVATGRGQFDLTQDPQPVPELDRPPDNPNAVVCLSTFQPAPGDPDEGCWEVFPKFGRLGPEVAARAAGEHRKNTLILFRPGAVVRLAGDAEHPPFLGRAIPMTELLPPYAAGPLAEAGINLIHPAFGLCLPMKIQEIPSL